MLRLLIACDANQETGVIKAILSLTLHNFYKFIEEVDYGNSLQYLAIFLFAEILKFNLNRPFTLLKWIKPFV